MTHDRRSFLDPICAKPGEDTHRLAYADWLRESGQAERADYIQQGVALSLIPACKPGKPTPEINGCAAGGCSWCTLELTQRELLKQHSTAWLTVPCESCSSRGDSIRARCATCNGTGDAGGLTWELDRQGSAGIPYRARPTVAWARGFPFAVEGVELTHCFVGTSEDDILDHDELEVASWLETVLTHWPIEKVRAGRYYPDAVWKLFQLDSSGRGTDEVLPEALVKHARSLLAKKRSS